MATESMITGIYTLTPLHCGTGQAAGAVDLPVAREHHTRLPILPATSLKGACRSRLRQDTSGESGAREKLVRLFGKELAPPADSKAAKTGSDADGDAAGDLVFHEGQLLALPVRSLTRAFVYVTSPLVLERFDRMARGLGLAGFEDAALEELDRLGTGARVAHKDLAQKTLVLEDRVFAAGDVQQGATTEKVAERLAKLLPAAGARTSARLKAGLVVVPDAVLVDLASRTLPVHARIQLTDGKTTDTWKDPQTGKQQSGNLWYEEVVPSDTLFAAFIGTRGGYGTESGDRDWFKTKFALHDTAQIGGNETVGHGRVWWAGEAKS